MAEFSNNATAQVKMKVNLNTDGNIAQEGEVQKGTKTPMLSGIKAGATLSEATKVFDAFYGKIAGGTYDSLSAVKNIHQGVVE